MDSGRLTQDMAGHSKEPLFSALKNLSINTNTQQPSAIAKKKQANKSSPVAESWEDAYVSSSENEEGITPPASATLKSPLTAVSTNTSTGSSTLSTNLTQGICAPPPTPISPQSGSLPRWTPDLASLPPIPDRAVATSPPTATHFNQDKRPEKQTSVASRMIAGALGIRAPKRTEEQKAYDRAMREKEAKRREKEREAENVRRREEKKAKMAIWEE
ncbi:hypothetical protein ACO22_02073 [Paracoccidioides brasiliensis]|uniref:Uncharacterized protein n=1 Tax=Paracoccidioides brasiliensis TaxID=121759 RepID=A0A1D2JJP4_PARBR|nr:hypothetical protein ACO22_02073 [Paracoccidioides brasiliensis]